MPRLPNPDTEELIRIYRKAQARILQKIIAANRAKNITVLVYQQRLLQQINRELAVLQAQTVEWVEDNMPLAYQRGTDIADKELISQFKAAGLEPPVFPVEFGIIDRQQIQILVNATQETFENLILATGSQLSDAINESVNEAIRDKISTGETLRQAQANITLRLEQQGIRSVQIIRNGRITNMQLEHYASMVARSTTAEVTNQAVLSRVVSVNGDLVKMTSHFGSCPICFPLQGRVYSITGKTPGYPQLEQAYSGGFANIHPNCKHRIVPYIEELKSPLEIAKDKDISNRPFVIEDMSPRVQKIYNRQLKAYNLGQQKNRDIYFNREQWKRYLSRMGSDAPQTFSGFMRMKNAGAESWQNLRSDYRAVGRKLKEEI